MALHWKLPVLVAGLALAGCCPTVIVAPHATRCDAGAELLAARCAPPQQISGDATFASVVDAMRADRQALSECGLSLDALRDSINRCNQAVDEFNKKVDELNAKSKSGSH